MIFRKRMILLAILLAGLTHVGIREVSRRTQAGIDKSSLYDVDNLTRFRTYVVERERWLTYQIPGQSLALRLFTNAALPEEARSKPVPSDLMDRPGYRYCVEYEILDQQGNVLRQSRYHFRASPLEPVSAAPAAISGPTGEGVAALQPGQSFFDETNLIPAGTRTMQLPLNDDVLSKADTIRVRLAAVDPMIDEVVTRLYTQYVNDEHDKQAAWNRLPQRLRVRLTRANVYPPSLLSSYEKSNLLRKRWTAAPPVGLEDREYVARRMYVPDQEAAADANDSATGVELCPGLKVTSPLPVEHGTSTIILSAEKGDVQRCQLRWYGKSVSERIEMSIPVSSKSTTFRPPSPGGMLELFCEGTPAEQVTGGESQTVMARVTWDADTEDSRGRAEGQEENLVRSSIDITPQARSTRMYAASVRQPLEFALTHVDNQPTPLRLNLRTQLQGVSTTMADRSAEWQLLGASGEVIMKGKLKVSDEVSHYDRLSVNSELIPVTEATQFHFLVPPDATKFRLFSSHEGLLATAFTRPPNCAKKTRAPDDYWAINRATLTRKTWFSIRPVDYKERVAGVGSVSCHRHMRPPGESDHLLTGDFQWESFQPDNLVAGRELLTQKTDGLPTRVESVPATFIELSRGDLAASWTGRRGRRSINPRLIYQVTEEFSQTKTGRTQRPSIRILIDGEEYFAKQLKSRSGELKLPVIDALKERGQQHQFRIESDPGVRMFVNYLQVESGSSWLRRFAHEIRPTMQFTYPKKTPGSELLMLRVFQQNGSTDAFREPMKVRVDVIPEDAESEFPVEPTEEMTIRNRIFELALPGPDGSVAIGSTRQFDVGTRCMIRLGEDLAVGNYKINLASGGTGYLMLYRSLPGRGEVRSVYRESIDE